LAKLRDFQHNGLAMLRSSTRAQQLLRWATIGHNRHGEKVGGCCALSVGELGPHLT